MKKRTDVEKLELIDAACDLFYEAGKLIEKAKYNLHLCGIETCSGYTEEVEDWEEFNSNVQVYSGIKKLEKITKEKAYFPFDFISEKYDKSRMLLRHGSIVFLQCSDPISTKHRYR